MPKKSFLQQLQSEIASIMKELGCTEAEAYFALRKICQSEIYKLGNRDLALATVASALLTLEVSREATELGANSDDPTSILVAIHLCVKRGFPFPEWLKKIVIKAVGDFLANRVKSLDEAFRVKRRYHRQAKAQEVFEKSYEIYKRCQALKAEGVKIGPSRRGDGLFERVAKEYGMSVTKTKDYYYGELKSYKEFVSMIRECGFEQMYAEEFYERTESAKKNISQLALHQTPQSRKQYKKKG